MNIEQYEEIIVDMRLAQGEILDALIARRGDAYAALVLETAKVFCVLTVFAGVEEEFRAQFLSAATAVLVCNAIRTHDACGDSSGNFEEFSEEFVASVRMLADKQTKRIKLAPGDAKS